MNPLHIETPIITSPAMAARAGRAVRLKCEYLQPTGSFKIRGIGFACQKYLQHGARRFISSSGGNAGIAVAYAGRALSVPVVVVVPETATEHARNLIRAQGSELVVHGRSWQEANLLAQSMVGQHDAFLHPFDDALLWQGHATMIDEVAQSGIKPDVVVLAVGGGGLLSGVIAGLIRNGWHDVPVIAVETAGADSFARSVAARERIELAAITSIATSLGARQICSRAFELSRSHPLHTAVVSDRSAVSACLQFFDDHAQMVEPACGAALAIAYDANALLAAFSMPLIIACGGSTVTIEQLRDWSAKLAATDMTEPARQ